MINKRDISCEIKKLYSWATHDPTVYMYSWGGNGTRMIYELIRKKYKMNGQADVHYKIHRWLPKNIRAFALIGHPIDSLKSFFRKQSSDDPTFIRRHCENLGIEYFGINNFEEYAKIGQDLFLFGDFWERLMKTPRNKDLMVIKFEDLWNNLETFLAYIEMDEIIDSFPPKQNRTNELSDVLDKPEIARLHNTYHQLISDYERLPSISMLKGKQ